MSEAKKCKATNWHGWRDYQCKNRATTEAGFCGTHDPKKREARRTARNEAARAEWKRNCDAREIRETTKHHHDFWCQVVVVVLLILHPELNR